MDIEVKESMFANNEIIYNYHTYTGTNSVGTNLANPSPFPTHTSGNQRIGNVRFRIY